MTEALSALVSLLDLEQIEVNVYRGQHPEVGPQRTFGGQVAAQALMAAGRTVTRGRAHSLHSYFLRPGDPAIPILYEVDRIRDGKSFTTRRVVAIQHGRAIYNMQASFHTDEPSVEHQFPMPDVPPPETILPLDERVLAEFGPGDEWFRRPHAIDQRYVGPLPWSPAHSKEPTQRLWIRAAGPLADDPLLHACIITYASDMSLFATILAPHAMRWDDGGFMIASLDHCMWFHRESRADEWLLYDTDSPVAFGGRGLARGFIFDSNGQLCISLAQEGLVRVPNPARQTA